METWQDNQSQDRHQGDQPVSAEVTSVLFAQIARQLSQIAVDLGLQPPAFRSPPRSPGLHRSIRRRADGSATVSVALRGRPAVAVVADMIDGVVAANEPASACLVDLRDQLWSAAAPLLFSDAGSTGSAGSQVAARRAA